MLLELCVLRDMGRQPFPVRDTALPHSRYEICCSEVSEMSDRNLATREDKNTSRDEDPWGRDSLTLILCNPTSI